MIYLNRYEVVEDARVQFGGQAQVFTCIDQISEDEVAVKVTNLATSLFARTFEREVKSLRRLSHEGIIEILDWGQENDQGIVVMPLMEFNLETFLASRKDLKPVNILQNLIVPLAEALAYAHENKVFHRDLKPSNVLMHSNGSPLISDFGSAKIYGPNETELTQLAWQSKGYTPDLTGTPAQHDVYSFAVMAIEVVTGKPARDLSHTLDLLHSEFAGQGGNKAIFSDKTKQILQKCLSLDPKNRYSSAIEMYSQFVERENLRRNKENSQKYFGWIKLDDRVRQHLEPLKAGFPNLEEGLRNQMIGAIYASPVKKADGTIKTNEFWLITERMKLHLKQNSQKSGWNAFEGKLYDSDSLEIQRTNGFDLTKLGIKWGINRNDPSPTKSRAGFEFINNAYSEWVLNGAPIDRGTNIAFQEVEGITSRWIKLLDAREEVATVNFKPLRFKNAKREGLRVYLVLEDPNFSDSSELYGDIDLEGTYWKLSFAHQEIAEVVMHLGNEVELLLRRQPKGELKPSGQMLPEIEIGLASQLRRQRVAIDSLVSRSSVQPKLGDMLANLSSIKPDAKMHVSDWKDPGLDDYKKEAVASALGTKDFLLVKGPPGTGKTSFIAEYVYQELKRDKNIQILLVSQTHVALDNALERLVNNGMTDCVRLGQVDDKRIAEKSKRLLVDVQMRAWMEQLRIDSNGFIEKEAIKAGVGVQESRALLTLIEIEEVQKTLARIEAEEKAEPENQTYHQSLNEVSLTSTEMRDKKKLEESRLFDLLARQLDGKLTIPKNRADLDILHIRGALMGNQDISKEFLEIIDTQAKWLDRVGSSSQLTPVFLKTRRLLAGTCVGFMSMPEVRDLKFDICIIDEASRATIPQALVSMVKAEKWVVVGDSNQLSPSEIELRNPEARAILATHEIEIEETEVSIFSFLEESLPVSKQVTLSKQYRMRNEIGQMVSSLFYDGEIESSGPVVEASQEAFFRAVEWSDTSNLPLSQKQEFRDKLSFSNRNEILIIQKELNLLSKFIQQKHIKTELLPIKPGEQLKVLIIAPYAAQIVQAKTIIGTTSFYPFDVEFNSIDAVQGREADIVFFSCVRMNERQEVGFMGPKNWRRINVALSRARLKIHIVGDAYFWSNTKSDLKDVVQYISEQKSDNFLKRDLAND
jgi:serine/threonine protein kinase